MEDILNAIEKDGDAIALVIFSGEDLYVKVCMGIYTMIVY